MVMVIETQHYIAFCNVNTCTNNIFLGRHVPNVIITLIMVVILLFHSKWFFINKLLKVQLKTVMKLLTVKHVRQIISLDTLWLDLQHFFTLSNYFNTKALPRSFQGVQVTCYIWHKTLSSIKLWYYYGQRSWKKRLNVWKFLLSPAIIAVMWLFLWRYVLVDFRGEETIHCL